MKNIGVAALCAVAFGLAGCVTNEVVSYNPSSTQHSITRDGVGALISQQPKSLVMVRPAGRGVVPGERPVYVVAVQNLSKAPMEIRVADIQVVQTKQGQFARALPVKSYEKLVEEEKTAQIIGAIALGMGAAANSMNASNAGYGTSHGTVTTSGPRGTYTSHVQTSYYSPAARQMAVANANAANNAMISDAADQWQANLASLEANVLKDNTVMPGEWIGGTVTFEAPRKEHADGKSKSYSIAVKIGDETHVVEAVQAPPAKG
jgi:hypothetical protein